MKEGCKIGTMNSKFTAKLKFAAIKFTAFCDKNR